MPAESRRQGNKIERKKVMGKRREKETKKEQRLNIRKRDRKDTM